MRLVVFRMLALFAFTLSACLWLDGINAQGLMCAPQGTCGQVAKSAFGNIAGIPLSFLGMVAFGTIGLASVSSLPWPRRASRWLAILAAPCAMGLIAVQLFVLSVICPWCLAIDLATVICGIIAWDSRSEAAVISRFSWQSWIVAYEIALIIPLSWSLFAPTASMPAPEELSLPQQAQTLWQPHLVNVVEYTSFDCPYCNMMRPIVERVVSEADGVNHVRILLPRAKQSGTWNAALSLICAENAGTEQELVSQFCAHADDLSPESCERIVSAANICREEFQACMADPKTESLLRSRIDKLKDGVVGLPMICIQDKVFLGVRSREELLGAIREARQKL